MLIGCWSALQAEPLQSRREFQAERLEELRQRRDFQYGERTEEANRSNPNRELERSYRRRQVGSGGGSFNQWATMMYILAAIGIVIVIAVVLSKNFAGKGQQISGAPLPHLESELQAMDFEALIQEALAQGAYRKAVRMLYLETIKGLTQHQWVQWRAEKTNQDYLRELKGSPLEADFDALTLHFDYIWYGNFAVDRELYAQIEQVFRAFQQKVDTHT